MSDERETFERAAFQALEEEAAARAILRGIDEHRWRSVTPPLPDAWLTLGMACELASDSEPA